MVKRHVLLIANSFPPVGGVGVLRATKFAKYLPAYGWDVTVLTANQTVDRVVDQSLLSDLTQVSVIRTATLEPLPMHAMGAKAGLLQVIRRLLNLVLIPDATLLWGFMAFLPGWKVLRRQSGLILATGGPFSNFVLAIGLGVGTGLPVVLDYRDEWSARPVRRVSTMYHRVRLWLEAWLEERLLQRAGAVITATAGMASEMRRRWPKVGHKLHVITNGFDNDLQAHAAVHDLCLTHAGTLYPSKEISSFLRSLEAALVARDVHCHIRLVGEVMPAVREEILAHPWRRLHPEFYPHLPYEQVQAYLVGSTANIALIDPQPGYERYHAQKFFDCLGAGRPVIVIARPKNDLEDILGETHAGWFLVHNAPPAAYTQLVEELLHISTDAGWREYQARFDPTKAQRFHRRILTQKLSALLTQVAQQHRGP